VVINNGSCIRLGPEYKNHVWSYDFIAESTSDGKVIPMLNKIDEYTEEYLAINVGRKITVSDVVDILAHLFIERGLQSLYAQIMDLSL
jgi:hypothetical protein